MANNKEIIKEVLKDMPAEYAEKLEGKEGPELLNVIKNYPAVTNSFITTLTNKVTKSLLYSKIYQNQLKELKKGALEYGDSIEELFVQMAQVKGFTANWESGSATPEADLIKKLVPKVSALYIQMNVDYKGKTTVMDKALRKAFLNSNGLQGLVGQIVGSITSAMEFQEFKLTKATLNTLVKEGKSIRFNGTDTTIQTNTIAVGTNGAIKQGPYCVDVSSGGTFDPKKLSQELREAVGLMKFPSTKFNIAKELTWSQPEEMMLITTPQVIADLDVNVLASAFNMSKADLNTRTILVDEMPGGIFKNSSSGNITSKMPEDLTSASGVTVETGKLPKAILVSKDLIQIWDTHQGTGTFHNPEGEYTNYFANREGIFATCLFANMAVFY